MKDLQRMAHLLQVHQIELEHQNQELRITQEELEVSRNNYVNLFDFSPLPYLTLNPEGIIKEVNISAGKMFGIDRSKFIGKQFGAYIPLDEKEIFTSFLHSVFSSPEKHTCELKVVSQDKRVFNVRLEAIEMIDTQEPDRKCQAAVIDLTK
jgi:PAS domain S-box-containing protein